jgi:hypothetical protein
MLVTNPIYPAIQCRYLSLSLQILAKIKEISLREYCDE